MSLALSTLVIVLFGVLPGATFELSLYSGKMARVRAPTPTLTDLAVAVGLSIPIHLATLAAVRLWSRDLRLDYSTFLHAVAGQFGENGQALDDMAALLETQHLHLVAYLALTLAVAFSLGQIVQYLLLVFPAADRLLPFRNRWFYRFFFPSGNRTTGCTAFVLTASSTEGQPILYQGLVTDFRVGVEGSLAELVLREPQRAFLRGARAREPHPVREDAMSILVRALATRIRGESERGDSEPANSEPVDSEPAEDAEPQAVWLPLSQDVFVLPGDQIANLSLQYTNAWRPLWVLANKVVDLEPGFRRMQVDVLEEASLAVRLLVRGLRSRARIVAQSIGEGSESLSSKSAGPRERFKLILEERRALREPLRVHLLLLWRTVQDSRSDKTGNLLFWLHHKVIEYWSRRTERKLAEVHAGVTAERSP